MHMNPFTELKRRRFTDYARAGPGPPITGDPRAGPLSGADPPGERRRTPPGIDPPPVTKGKRTLETSMQQKEIAMSYSNVKSPPGHASRIIGTLFVLMSLAGMMWTPLASANATADAVILNVVTVNYDDASGTSSFSATASSSVTINLVEAAVTISGRPTVGSQGDTAAQPAELTGGSAIASGTTGTYLYAITSNANGDDAYNTAGTAIDAVADVANQTVTFQTVDPDGSSNPAAMGASITLEAGIVVSVPAVNQLTFPGNTMTNITGAGDEIIVFDGVDYLVTATSGAGNVGSHDNPGGVAHADVGVTTTETQVTLTLAANPDGANVAPAFDNVGNTDDGKLARQQVLLLVSVFADANNPPANGFVDFDIVIDPNASPASVADQTTEFIVVALTITKEVRNESLAGAFAATATGDPGEILEYRVTVTNAGGDATVVIVDDAVPSYTTLVTHTAAYGDQAAGGIFAQVTDMGGAGTSVDITSAADDDEDGVRGSGNAAGTTAGSAMLFYIGAGNADSTNTGGTVTSTSPADSFTILYQVQID